MMMMSRNKGNGHSGGQGGLGQSPKIELCFTFNVMVSSPSSHLSRGMRYLDSEMQPVLQCGNDRNMAAQLAL
jgi:hypothetical protein